MLARRNAFLMLTHCDLRNALDFFITECQDKIDTYPDTMQITILELMRRVCRELPVPKSIFVKSALLLLDSSSNAVVYEAANTLLSLTPLDSAVNKSLEAYTRLLQSESDQNVKLIVIKRLNALKNRYFRNLRRNDFVMDILRSLSTPNIDIRKQILTIILDLSSGNNINDIIDCLKKEIQSLQYNEQTQSNEEESQNNIIEYRNLLVETIHECAVKYPSVASDVVHLLMNYLGDDSTSKDVIIFVKEILQDYKELRDGILNKLFLSFKDIKLVDVYRVALWIFGEYSLDINTIKKSITTIMESIGELPLQTTHIQDEEDKDEKEDKSNKDDKNEIQYVTRTVILENGTYAQETVAINKSAVDELKMDTDEQKKKSEPQLRILLKQGQYYLASVLSSTLTKLILRMYEIKNVNKNIINEFTSKCLLIITTIIRHGTSSLTKNKMDNDTKDRMLYAINKLLNPIKFNNSKILNKCILTKCKNNFNNMLKKKRLDDYIKEKKQKKEINQLEKKPFDTLLNIRHLKGLEFTGFDEDDLLNIKKAAGTSPKNKNNNNNNNKENILSLSKKINNLDVTLKTRLSRVHQLTGFSDDVYAEACVTVHQFDIVLDFLIINNTNITMQNVMLELHTSGDLKLIDKPEKFTLAPKKLKKLSTSIKVSSTENGVIFGNIVYNKTGATIDNNIVVMNCIHMDIMDYVKPSHCDEKQFRNMWVEFEWENKVPVNTDIDNLKKYLYHIKNITNMQLLTPMNDNLSENINFLAANLHAKSIFGEHALMNVSIEYNKDLKVTGHIRIRCKSQGIALSLGEKITNKQKKVE